MILLEDIKNSRARILLVVLAFSFLVLLLISFKVQILDKSFQQTASITSLDKKVIRPSRGMILDRNKDLLVYNEFQYDLYAVYNDISPEMNKDKFCELLAISDSTYDASMNKDWSSNQFSKDVPFLMLKSISDTIGMRFMEHGFEFPGFELRRRPIRGYNLDGSGGLIGYLSEASKDDLLKDGELVQGDVIGSTGIEAYYDQILRGEKGINYELKDNKGRKIGSYNEGESDIPTVAGHDLILGIDRDLQEMAEGLLKNKKGAIVAIEPKTGEILSILSSPTYNPKDLRSGVKRNETFRALSQDTLRPLFDRANMSHYPPGSTFKTVLALIALQEGVISPYSRITCQGGYYYKDNVWGCHAGSGSRNLDLAISQSCNTFFYTVYARLVEKYGYSRPELGLDKIVSYLSEMGIGHKLGIDLAQEATGLNPDPDYYNTIYPDSRWRSTYIISNAIGQGEVELTTLQMANLAALIANRGYYFPPHLIKNYDIAPEKKSKYQEKITPSIDRKNYDYVVEGMYHAVMEGTATSAIIPGVQVCGKTGTSQNPHGKDHSVFFGFAPKENPQIAVAVFIENGGWGGSYAAPMASLMMEKYVTDTLSPASQYKFDYLSETNLLNTK